MLILGFILGLLVGIAFGALVVGLLWLGGASWDGGK